MGGVASYVGVEDIMSAFDTFSNESGAYSLWYSDREKAMDWNNPDFERGREILKDTLEALAQSGNSRIFYLKFYPELPKGIIDKKTPYSTCLHVQAVKGDSPAINGFGNMHPSMIAAFDSINKIPAMISGIEQRLVDLENGEIDERELSATDKFLGMINGLLENPQIQERLIGLVMNKFLPGQSVPTINHAINGVAENVSPSPAPAQINMDMVNEALQRLTVHCNIDTDLMLMAKMAETNPGMFKFLLDSLRKGV